MKTILAIIFVAAFLATSIEAKPGRAPPNMSWSTCASACPARCGEPHAKICTAQCIIGYACNPGYILRRNGPGCVRPSEC